MLQPVDDSPWRSRSPPRHETSNREHELPADFTGGGNQSVPLVGHYVGQFGIFYSDLSPVVPLASPVLSFNFGQYHPPVLGQALVGRV